MADSTIAKPVHTIVLDAGPILKNNPPLSTLLAQCEELVITPSVLGEIRDPDARQRIQTLYLPFLKQRAPSPKSFNIASEFARKTGDRAVLSRTDIEVLALAYEIECERNGGDWRLRSIPGQKQVNGKPPAHLSKNAGEQTQEAAKTDETTGNSTVEKVTEDLEATTLKNKEQELDTEAPKETETEPEHTGQSSQGALSAAQNPNETGAEEDGAASESDGEEWITPSNLKKRQALDETGLATATSEPKVMQVATMTTDFACQNVLLQMNLNLLSTATLQRIKHLKSFIKRCHACFSTTKDMSKQFCPRCGGDTLTRVSCTTTANGQFQMHLKKNMQWNNRGNVFSVPKPIHGTSNGKWQGGGGKGGWGTELILAEDQKEYIRATTEQSRKLRRERDLMDEDYLPGILTGERNKQTGRIRTGAGRHVNSRKR
ncbi:Nin one binding Zn-ribbon like-domain-containing protein [Aspergillus crustosus]